MKIKKIVLGGLAMLTSAVFLASAPITQVQAGMAVTPTPTPANPSDIGVSVTVDETISLSVNTIAVDIGTLSPSSIANQSAAAADGTLIATVTTNNDAGWELTIKDSDTETGLTKTAETHKFLAHTGTFSAPTAFATTDSYWGYRVGNTWTADTYAGITTAEVEINSNTNSAPNGATTELGFGAQLQQGIYPSSGAYTDVITLTASPKV